MNLENALTHLKNGEMIWHHAAHEDFPCLLVISPGADGVPVIHRLEPDGSAPTVPWQPTPLDLMALGYMVTT